jgi:hypothetical protein
VKLDTFEGVLFVANTLNHTRRAIRLGNPGSNFQALGKSDVGASKRMVSSHWDILLETGENALGVMRQRRGLAVEPFSSRAYFTSVDIKHALPIDSQRWRCGERYIRNSQSHANSKNWDFTSKVSDHIPAYTRVRAGVTGSRANNNLGRVLLNEFVQCDLVIAEDMDSSALQDKILVNIPREGVVVIDQDEIGSSGDRRRGLRLVWRVINNVILRSHFYSQGPNQGSRCVDSEEEVPRVVNGG